MTARSLRVSLAAVAAVGAVALTGCGAAAATDASASTPAGSAAPAAATTAATTQAGFPDPCTLLTNAEVTQLTGHAVTRTDPDGLGTDAPTRHCQWQLESGDLAIFLTTTTESDFKVRDPAAQDVSGVGDEAYTSAGHLFVRTDQTQVDIYARSADDDATNLAVAKATFEKLLPKVR
jgi:hypothetical protein